LEILATEDVSHPIEPTFTITPTKPTLYIPEIEYSNNSANHTTPEDVLREITFAGGGEGGSFPFCKNNYQEPAADPDTSDSEAELLDTFTVNFCGWQKDEYVLVTIEYPNGSELQEEYPTDWSQYTDNEGNTFFPPASSFPSISIMMILSEFIKSSPKVNSLVKLIFLLK
jgi:hypothetical protein